MANQIIIPSRYKAPTKGNSGITSGAIAVFPCRHATTDTVLSNIADPLVTGEPGAAFNPATAFASPQGLLTADAAATDTTMRLSPANFTYSYNSNDSLLIATRVKLTTSLPGSTKPVWAQGGNNSTAQGWQMKCTTSGGLLLQYDHPGGSGYLATTDAGGPAGNGLLTADTWFSVVAAIWDMNASAGTGKYGIWIDGKRAYTTGDKSMSSMPAAITPTEAFRIGQYYRTSGPVTLSIGATQSDFHIYRAPQAVVLSQTILDKLASRLHRDPTRPLTPAEWAMS